MQAELSMVCVNELSVLFIHYLIFILHSESFKKITLKNLFKTKFNKFII